MPHTLNTLAAFSAGEWSPTLDSRVDLPGYRKACRKLRNMIPMKQGGATRRPGTQFIGAGKQASSGQYTSRLESFQYAPGTTFQLEFTQYGIRFFTTGTLATQITVVNSSTTPNAYQVQASAFDNTLAYAAGSFVTAANGSVYYAYNGIVAIGGGDPSTNLSYWRLQSVYEVPSPYSSLGITSTTGTVTPYPANDYWGSDIFIIQIKQINDVVYIVHPNLPVWKLIRYANNNWVMQQVQFNTPAMLDENQTDIILCPSAASGTNITLTATAPYWTTGHYYAVGNTVTYQSNIWTATQINISGVWDNDVAAGYWKITPIFNSQHIGSYWQLAFNRSQSFVEWDFASGNGTSTQLTLVGTWEVQTYGTWSADVTIQASYDNGVTFQNISVLTSKGDANYSISGQELSGGIYQMVISNYSSLTSSTPPRVVLTADNQYVYGLAKITGVTDSYHATCTAIVNFYPDPTYTGAVAWSSGTSYVYGNIVTYGGEPYFCQLSITGGGTPNTNPGNWVPCINTTTGWSEGAWSNYRGYPQAIAIFQERVWYAGTTYQPQRVWGTQTNDIENFALIDQSQATYGLAFDLNAPSRGPIRWMNAQTDLMVGLAAAEWIISSGQPNTAISPTSVTAVEHSANGSAAYLPGDIIGNAAFYVQRRGTSFNQMLFSVFTNKYMSQDVLTYSQHLTNSGIQQFDYQQEFENQSILWAVCGDGTLISMTYSLEQEIFAWAKHTTGTDNGDKVLSVSVIYGANGSDDEVWVTVMRNPATTKGCQIERVWPISWQTDNIGQPLLSEACYVDCATYYTPSTAGSNTISGLPVALYNRPVVAALIPASGTGIISFRNLTCSNTGTVTLPNYKPITGDVIWVGLPIYWYLQPMRLDVDQRAGEVVGLTRAISKLYVRVVNSIGGQWSTPQGDVVDIQVYPITENSGNPPPFVPNIPLYLELDVGGLTQYELDATFTLQGYDPLPMTVLGVTIKQDIGGSP